MKKLKIIIYLSLLPLSIFAQEENLFKTINVPIDYVNQNKGFTTVSYEFGADFSENKPTVFIIADAQQFYVRKGTIANLQTTLLV